MSARRQRPPWNNCSKFAWLSLEARRQSESCMSADAPSGTSLIAALEDCGPASCVRKTADSVEPPRYRCKGNALLTTWPSYCFQEKLILHLEQESARHRQMRTAQFGRADSKRARWRLGRG